MNESSQERENRLSGTRNESQEGRDHRFTTECDNLTNESDEHRARRFNLIRKRNRGRTCWSTVQSLLVCLLIQRQINSMGPPRSHA